jgi:tetratricopeptide (TPR) repeat protein
VKKGDKVALLYVITLENGQEVANSFNTKVPLHLVAGQEQSIPGVDLALLTMKLGDKIRLVVNYENGFGKYDNPHGFHGSNILIPGRSTLYFTEVHLLNPELAIPKSSNEWLEIAESQKNEGNTAFQKKEWNNALKHYEKSLNTLESVEKNLNVPIPADLPKEKIEKRQTEDDEARSKLKTQKVTCYSNIAACHLSKKEYQKTKEFCKMALDIDPNHVKSLYRMSKVHSALIDYDAALKVLLEAQKITDTKEIQKEIILVKKSISEKAASDKKAFGGFFNKLEGEGLYEGVEPKAARWTCHECGEEMDEIQKARHFIKKHGEPKKDKI